MALNIKNAEVERLASEVATLAHESKTEAIRKALLERRTRLHVRAGKAGRLESLRDFMEKNVWPFVPPSELGRTMSREEKEKILGYGPGGY
jgi:antitoxin VapB